MSNEKIIRWALAQKFKGDDVDIIYHLAMATPNPQVSIEMLLGIYESPKNILRFASEKFCASRGYIACQFMSYDSFTNTLKFLGTRVNDLKQWKGRDGSIVSLIDYVDEKDMLTALVVEGAIEQTTHFRDYFTPIDEIEIEDTCTLEEWG